MVSVLAYADPWVVAPGDTVRFRCAAAQPANVGAAIERILCASVAPQGPPLDCEPVALPVPATLALLQWQFQAGNRVDQTVSMALRAAPQFSVGLALSPWRWPDDEATLVDLGTAKLVLGRHGVIGLRDALSLRPLCRAPALRQWGVVALTVDRAAGHLRCLSHHATGLGEQRRWLLDTDEAVALDDDFALGLRARWGEGFDGRLDRTVLALGADGMSLYLQGGPCVPPGCEVAHFTSLGPHDPLTQVRGVAWGGRCFVPSLAPHEYSAAHFHSDDLRDAGWASSCHWQVPADAPSGAYALRVDSAPTPQRFVFFVSGAARPRHRLAVWLPTYSYLAYANAPDPMRGPPGGAGCEAVESLLAGLHPACGRSLYEKHADGLGVHLSSDRRPILSAMPGHRPWQFVADSLLLAWLQAQGLEHDLITDHDVQRDGAAALAPYAAVLTGHHPEYTSSRMWDATAQWLDVGGRLLYLGGNGYYHRIAVSADGRTIEARRAEDGTRPFIGEPGEYHFALPAHDDDHPGAELGGLWRRLGRSPQSLVGVGMAAQGFDSPAGHYRRRPESRDPAVAWVFEGVDGETFGHAGLLGGGAAGWEIDRLDPTLGTPLATWWLASSEGHGPDMLRTKEELLSTIALHPDRKARADLVLLPRGERGGAVFSVGSMCWIGALATDDGVARITRNVIDGFLAGVAVPPSPYGAGLR
jgi:N,N-dimethylformamidase